MKQAVNLSVWLMAAGLLAVGCGDAGSTPIGESTNSADSGAEHRAGAASNDSDSTNADSSGSTSGNATSGGSPLGGSTSGNSASRGAASSEAASTNQAQGAGDQASLRADAAAAVDPALALDAGAMAAAADTQQDMDGQPTTQPGLGDDATEVDGWEMTNAPPTRTPLGSGFTSDLGGTGPLIVDFEPITDGDDFRRSDICCESYEIGLGG